jgi:hypothetical protein
MGHFEKNQKALLHYRDAMVQKNVAVGERDT